MHPEHHSLQQIVQVVESVLQQHEVQRQQLSCKIAKNSTNREVSTLNQIECGKKETGFHGTSKIQGRGEWGQTIFFFFKK